LPKIGRLDFSLREHKGEVSRHDRETSNSFIEIAIDE
jgi:hypothetical protein